MQLPSHIYDPGKHATPPKSYIVKECSDCKCLFLCPSNWRRTHRCPDCTKDFKIQADLIRQKTKKLLRSSKADMVCEVCRNTELVQVHHRIPIVKGGKADLDNVELLCIKHHQEAHKGRLSR